MKSAKHFQVFPATIWGKIENGQMLENVTESSRSKLSNLKTNSHPEALVLKI